MIPTFPIPIRYTLSRMQRLVPHLRMWGIGFSLFVPGLFLFFLVCATFGAWEQEIRSVLFFGLLAAGMFRIFHNFFRGLM